MSNCITNPIRFYTIVFILGFVCGCDASTSGNGKQPSQLEMPEQRNPSDTLSVFSNRLGESRCFAVNIKKQTVLIDANNKRFEDIQTYRIYVCKPLHLSFTLETGLTGITLICNGKELYTQYKPFTTYAIGPAPHILSDVASEKYIGKKKLLCLNSLLLAAPLFYDDFNNALIKLYEEPRALGVLNYKGQDFAVMSMRVRDLGDIELWFTKKDSLLAKVATSDQTQQVSLSIHFSDWIFDQEFPKDIFEITPPPGLLMEKAPG